MITSVISPYSGKALVTARTPSEYTPPSAIWEEETVTVENASPRIAAFCVPSFKEPPTITCQFVLVNEPLVPIPAPKAASSTTLAPNPSFVYSSL